MTSVDEVRELILAKLAPLDAEEAEVKAELEQAKAEIKAKLAQTEAVADERLDKIQQEKTRFQNALEELNPRKKPKSKASRKAKPKAARKNTTGERNVRQSDVMAVLVDLVKANGSIERDVLEVMAKDKLSKELGFDLKGFGLRLGECLSSGKFVMASDDTISLASVMPDEAVHTGVTEPELPVET